LIISKSIAGFGTAVFRKERRKENRRRTVRWYQYRKLREKKKKKKRETIAFILPLTKETKYKTDKKITLSAESQNS
jgi:hypothetical protein